MLTIDCESEGGAWRRELLARPLNVSELRDMIEELEHCLKVSRDNFETSRRQNVELVKKLAEAVAREMEVRAEVARLNEELQRWNSRKTA
jgi:hypothetical protein